MNKFRLVNNFLGSTHLALKKPSFYNFGGIKNYRQCKDLNQIMYTTTLEEAQRTEKFLEYTHKVYKPSKTITFDRNGEVLLFACDAFRHSQVFLKYPYCLIDSALLLTYYNFFADPFNMGWHLKHGLFYFAITFGYMPHLLYIRSLQMKIYKIYLMRGGKYSRVEYMDFYGEQYSTWITNKEIHTLSEDFKRFETEESFEFLNKDGQLKFELALQIDNYQYHGLNQNNEVIYFMKEGTVYEPELFEVVARGYNVDTSDFEINTEDNVRWHEPTKNNHTDCNTVPAKKIGIQA